MEESDIFSPPKMKRNPLFNHTQWEPITYYNFCIKEWEGIGSPSKLWNDESQCEKGVQFKSLKKGISFGKCNVDVANVFFL